MIKTAGVTNNRKHIDALETLHAIIGSVINGMTFVIAGSTCLISSRHTSHYGPPAALAAYRRPPTCTRANLARKNCHRASAIVNDFVGATRGAGGHHLYNAAHITPSRVLTLRGPQTNFSLENQSISIVRATGHEQRDR